MNTIIKIRLEKIARACSDLHIEMSVAASENLLAYPVRTQNAILRIQEQCLGKLRHPTLTETDRNQETTQ